MASTTVLSHRDTADGSLQAPNCCAARPTGKPGALRLNDCHPVAQFPQTTQPLSVPRDLLGTARNSLTRPPPQTVPHVNLWIPNMLPEGSSSHDDRLHGGRDAVPTTPHHRDRQSTGPRHTGVCTDYNCRNTCTGVRQGALKTCELCGCLKVASRGARTWWGVILVRNDTDMPGPGGPSTPPCA